MPAFSLLGGLVFAPLVGLLATLAMDPVMARLPGGDDRPEGSPASVLADTPVDDAPERLATWVHYVAGAGSGLLFVGLVAAVGTLTGSGSAVTLALAGFVMVALMVGFFALVPLPRATGLAGQRLSRIRRDWAVSAVVYVAVAAVLVAVAAAV